MNPVLTAHGRLISSVSRRGAVRQLVPCLLTVLLLMQGLVPAGYMPASAASGWLVMLCPDGLPARYLAETAHVGGEHPAHHHDEQRDAVAADYCPVGSAVETPALASLVSVSGREFGTALRKPAMPASGAPAAPRSHHQARAPPSV